MSSDKASEKLGVMGYRNNHLPNCQSGKRKRNSYIILYFATSLTKTRFFYNCQSRVGEYSYPLFLLGENTTDIPKQIEETMAIDEPTGKSKRKETKIPSIQYATPTKGEIRIIFFIS